MTQKEPLRSPQRALVRARRSSRLRPSFARDADGLRAGGMEGPAGHCDPQHLVGCAALPHAFQEPRRRRQARYPDGRRLSDGAAGTVVVGIVPEADHHALPQHAGDGCRGIAARASGRRRGVDGRLRQNHPGPVARRHQHGYSRDLSARRSDAARQLERQDAGLGFRRLEVLGRAARRKNLRQGLGRRRGRHRALLRHLHDHGHRLDHDRDRRIDRHDLARRVVDPGG